MSVDREHMARSIYPGYHCESIPDEVSDWQASEHSCLVSSTFKALVSVRDTAQALCKGMGYACCMATLICSSLAEAGEQEPPFMLIGTSHLQVSDRMRSRDQELLVNSTETLPLPIERARVTGEINLRPKILPRLPEPVRLDNGIVRDIAAAQDLEALGLFTVDGASQTYLETLFEQVFAGLEDHSYAFHFVPVIGALRGPAIFGLDAHQLSHITRTTRSSERSCTTSFSLDGEEIRGGRSSTATAGICGVIATLHSLVKLGKLTKAEAFTVDKKLTTRALKKLAKQKDKAGMTFPELREAHAVGGVSKCKHPGDKNGAHFQTGPKASLHNFNSLLKFVKNGKPAWDCTLLVRSSIKKGRYKLSHWEHITDMSVKGGKVTINSTNGFNQGNGNHANIPASPGTNTWEFTPGGTPSGRLSRSTDPAIVGMARRGGWQDDIAHVSYVCCTAP